MCQLLTMMTQLQNPSCEKSLGNAIWGFPVKYWSPLKGAGFLSMATCVSAVSCSHEHRKHIRQEEKCVTEDRGLPQLKGHFLKNSFGYKEDLWTAIP